MTILASAQPLLTSKEQMQVATGIHSLKHYVTMNKLIWKLYNDNMISLEVANLLLDKHYNRLQHKRYE